MNNLGDALKQAGYSVPEAKKKVDSSRINSSKKKFNFKNALICNFPSLAV